MVREVEVETEEVMNGEASVSDQVQNVVTAVCEKVDMLVEVEAM